MELRTYLAILWRRKWVIAVTVVVTLAVVVIGTRMITPTYVASATLRVAPAVRGPADRSGWDEIQYVDRLINTYTEIATSSPVLEELKQRLNLSESLQIEVEIPANTELMQIKVRDQNPVLAAVAANHLADILISQSRKNKSERGYTLSLVDPAVVPQSPAQPRKELNIAVGLMFGLVGGLGLAFLFENLDTRLYTTRQIELATELTTLGEIPTARKRQQTSFLNCNSPQGEAFRYLRTKILSLNREVPPRTLLITSAEPGEGKSTIVANLAYTIAQSGRSVIVVDGDLRLPTLHKIFELPNTIGLSTILKRESTLAEAVQCSATAGVQVLTSGPLPPNPAELLGSPQMTALIEQLKRRFDLVLLDSPAYLAVTDAAILAPLADGVVLVVGRAQIRQEAVRTARQELVNINANLMGIVVNRAEQDRHYHSYYSTKANV